MARARKDLVCASSTPYYHIYSRCVRRAFLCGFDSNTGKSYEHRRGWIEDRLRVLSSLFSIELCAYAIMGNHYHLVVKLNPKISDCWSDDEVLERWTAIYRGPLLVQRYLAGEALCLAEQDSVSAMAGVFRARLGDLSWFMKCLNEPIARMANAEDGCTGHFWEARFQSQALRSDRALLAAMAYVDLNPIRAGIATAPEQSVHTSIRHRLLRDRTRTIATAVAHLVERGDFNHCNVPARPLSPFSDSGSTLGRASLPITEREYFNLVDITGRRIVRGKCGRIDPALEPILKRLNMSAEQWLSGSTAFRETYRNGDILEMKVA